MSYSKEQVQQLTELLQRVQGRKEHVHAAPSYRDSEDLQAMAALILDRPDDAPDTLTDAIAVLGFLADSYMSMGRSAVAQEFYEKILQTYRLLVTQRPLEEEEQEDLQDSFYGAVRARNYYAVDNCGDLCSLVVGCISQEQIAQLRSDAMERARMTIRHDPVEATKEYLAVIDEVEKLVDENKTVELCFEYWNLKAMYLSERGITWRSPAQLNPGVMFD